MILTKNVRFIRKLNGQRVVEKMLKTIDKKDVTKLTKGKRTKNLILESAIVILSKHGVKGATHRAIAAHASIQLSLTTYYFKDIHDLIFQAFELNSKNILSRIESRWQPVKNIVYKFGKTELKKVSVRTSLRDKLATLISESIIDNAIHHRESLIVEQHMFSEASVCNSLRRLADEHREALRNPARRLCALFTHEGIDVNADILLTVVRQQEYNQLLNPSSNAREENLRLTLNKILSIVTHVKFS